MSESPQGKKWYQSRTIKTNLAWSPAVITIALAVLNSEHVQLLLDTLPPEKRVTYTALVGIIVVVLTNFANIQLRLITSEPIQSSDSTKDEAAAD